jgi:hypothetical protein
MGEALGFAFVASGPMVRSSYRTYGELEPVAVFSLRLLLLTLFASCAWLPQVLASSS